VGDCEKERERKTVREGQRGKNGKRKNDEDIYREEEESERKRRRDCDLVRAEERDT
jgi:hypothetical protein